MTCFHFLHILTQEWDCSRSYASSIFNFLRMLHAVLYYSTTASIHNSSNRDFPGCWAVRTLPSDVQGAGLTPGWGAKIPHASRPKNQSIKQKQHCKKKKKKFNKDSKNGPHQKKKEKEKRLRASLVVQWLGVCLPMWGTLVWSVCLGGFHMLRGNWACTLWLLKLVWLEPMLHIKRRPLKRSDERVAPAHCN